MTDTDKLKRLAEVAIKAGDPFVSLEDVADHGEFQAAAKPATILALIAENEAKTVQFHLWDEGYQAMKAERDEAVAMLWRVWREVATFLNRIDTETQEK